MSEYLTYLVRFIRVPTIIILAIIVTRISKTLVNRVKRGVIEGLKMADQAPLPDFEVKKRAETIAGVLSKTIIAVIWVIAGLMLLNELGFDPKPILAGAGIVGIAVGFGAQSLVKDVISGLFMIVENQIRVGDVAILNGTGGLVEAIHLRTTVLRGTDGTVHVFPNGTITSLSNMTREFSYYVFNIGVGYKEDVDRVIGVIKDVGEEMIHDETYKSLILEPLEIFGLDSFGDSAVTIKARIKTIPIQQWAVGREMNRRIKKRFDAENIHIPLPHRMVYFGEDGLSPAVKTDHEKDRLRDLIREIIKQIENEEK